MTTEELVNNFLAHYGVKGMRWGVRKKAKFGGKTDANGPASQDHKSVSELRKKPLHQLSNDDIRKLNERINLERQFKNLNPDKVQKGTKTAHRMLDTLGVGVKAFNMLNSPAGKAAIGLGAVVAGKKLAQDNSKIFLDRLKEL